MIPKPIVHFCYRKCQSPIIPHVIQKHPGELSTNAWHIAQYRSKMVGEAQQGTW